MAVLPLWFFPGLRQLHDRGADNWFTDLADRISTGAGSWRVTAAAALLIIIWAALGPRAGFSDSWQLWINTPTTVVELFLGLFMLAAANRVEKRNYELHQAMVRILRHLEQETDAEVLDIAMEGRILVRLEGKIDRILER